MSSVDFKVFCDNWRDRLVRTLTNITELQEDYFVGVTRNLIKQEGALKGETLKLATSLIADLDAIWEHSLLIGPVLNKITLPNVKNKNIVSKEEILRKSTIQLPKRNTHILTRSLQSLPNQETLGLEDFMKRMEEDFASIQNGLKKLSEARDLLNEKITRLRKIIRTSEQTNNENVLNELEQLSMIDPIQAYDKLLNIEVSIIKNASLKEICFREFRIAELYLEHLKRIAEANIAVIAPLQDVENWLTIISTGSFAGQRYQAALVGLMNWSSLASFLEKNIQNSNKEKISMVLP